MRPGGRSNRDERTSERCSSPVRKALAVLALILPTLAFAESRYSVRPAPSWVETLPIDTNVATPARVIRHKLIWPASRPLRFRSTIRGVDPRIDQQGNMKVFTWERLDVPALDVEDDTPDWFDPYDHVQVSEFASWSDVAKWAD